MRRVIRKSKPLQAALLSAAAVAAMLGVAAAPAQAASSSCTAPYWYWDTRSCTTGTVGARSSDHSLLVKWTFCSQTGGTNWKVWDVNTGVTVASGDTTGAGSRRIYGLYGQYKAKIWNACYLDKITLTNA